MNACVALTVFAVMFGIGLGVAPREFREAWRRPGPMLRALCAGKTGVLVRPDPGAAEIVAAVLELTEERARAMRFECEAQARNFSRSRFTAELDKIVRAES